MKQQDTTAKKSKNPNLCNRPVMTHLSATEFTELEHLSKKSLRSLSSTVRMLIVNGLEISE